MLHPAPLLALDWVQIAILLFIVVSSLAGQLFKTNQERQRKAGGRPADPRAAEPQAAAPKPNRPRGPLQKEIETFLQRATGQQPGDAEVVSAEIVPEQVVANRAATSKVPPRAAARPIVEVPQHETVAEHVARRLQHAESGLQRRDAHLGSLIEQTDERMESRLEQRFDHTLGQLSSTSSSGAPQEALHRTEAPALQTISGVGTPISAGDLAQLLSSPQEFANAIVLSEILKRPIDRWS